MTVTDRGEENAVMDAAGFTSADRAVFLAALDIPGDRLTPRECDVLLRYEDARANLDEEDRSR